MLWFENAVICSVRRASWKGREMRVLLRRCEADGYHFDMLPQRYHETLYVKTKPRIALHEEVVESVIAIV